MLDFVFLQGGYPGYPILPIGYLKLDRQRLPNRDPKGLPVEGNPAAACPSRYWFTRELGDGLMALDFHGVTVGRAKKKKAWGLGKIKLAHVKHYSGDEDVYLSIEFRGEKETMRMTMNEVLELRKDLKHAWNLAGEDMIKREMGEAEARTRAHTGEGDFPANG